MKVDGNRTCLAAEQNTSSLKGSCIQCMMTCYRQLKGDLVLSPCFVSITLTEMSTTIVTLNQSGVFIDTGSRVHGGMLI